MYYHKYQYNTHYFKNIDTEDKRHIGQALQLQMETPEKIFLNEILTELVKKRKFFPCGQNYRFCFKSKQDIYEVLSYLYADATIFLDRKYEKVQEFMALNDYQMVT